MSQVISTKSGAAIGVLLGGTGRAPATTCKPVMPMCSSPGRVPSWTPRPVDATRTWLGRTTNVLRDQRQRSTRTRCPFSPMYLSCKQSVRFHKAREAHDRRIGEQVHLVLRALILTDPQLRTYQFTAAAATPDQSDLFFGTTGLGVVRFDGQDDCLGRALGRTLDEFSAFLVAAPRSNAGGFRAFLAAHETGKNDYTTGFTIDQSAPASAAL